MKSDQCGGRGNEIVVFLCGYVYKVFVFNTISLTLYGLNNVYDEEMNDNDWK